MLVIKGVCYASYQRGMLCLLLKGYAMLVIKGYAMLVIKGVCYACY